MFVYYNNNPLKENIGDCVIRAISLALDIDYYDILELLYNNSNYFNCDMLVRDCYAKLLDDFGCQRFKASGQTVEQVANDFPNSRVIIRINEHLTCAIYGVIYDTWDTSNEIVDTFWIVE